MGLDGIELVLALEEAFGVELSDEEVYKTETPKQIGEVIFSKLQITDEKKCQSQKAFYILRRSFMDLFGLNKKSITPNMSFRYLIPKKNEKELWDQIKLHVHARSWPELLRPRWMVWAITFTILIGCTYLFIVLKSTLAIYFIIPIWIIFSLILRRILLKITAPFKKRISPRFTLIRDLVPYAVTSEQIKWTKEQVFEHVKKIVMEQLNIKESDYSETAHFVKDYGIG